MIPDVRTLWMVLAATGLRFGILEVLVGSGRQRDTAMVLWGCGNLAAGVGAGLLSAHGMLPYASSEATANGFLALCFGLMWAGVRAFARQRVLWPVVVSGPLMLVIACLYIPPIPTDIVMRIHLVSLVLVGYLLLIAVDALRAERTERLVMRRVLAVVCIVAALPVIWRSATTGLNSEPYDLMGNSAAAAMPLVALFVAATVINICLLLIGRERLGNQLAHAAVVDGLTGTLNRSGFLNYAQQVIHENRPTSRSNSVVVMDLDQFKAVNDHYGHAAGDVLIAGFAAIAHRVLRSDDVLERIGGEEFCALLVDLSEPEAVAIADRLRLAFAEAGFDYADGTLAGTVSVGVAELGADEELATAIQRADRAMYQAKQSGRDRVIRASE